MNQKKMYLDAEFHVESIFDVKNTFEMIKVIILGVNCEWVAFSQNYFVN